jgi:sec-independent protein translocase protein TatA
MGSFSIWHWLVVLAVILVLFGGGNKISGVMGDFAKGIKAFKKNMAEPDDVSAEEHASRPPGTISGPAAQSPAQPRETASAQPSREHSTTL